MRELCVSWFRADLLSKSYVYQNKVELKSTTANGVTFTTDATVSKPASANVKAEFASGNFKVDKLSIGTDKKINGEFSLLEAFPGTKLIFKCVALACVTPASHAHSAADAGSFASGSFEFAIC